MRTYRHLSRTKRLQLESLYKAKIPIRDIAEQLNVHISTVYRELKRGECQLLNGDTWIHYKAYSPDIAEDKYRYNLSNKGQDIKLGKDYELAEYIENKIVNEKYSPLAVLGEIKHQNLEFSVSLSVNTLYKYIERGYIGNVTLKHLPMRSKRKRGKRTLVIKRPPKGTSIEERPKEILKRLVFGHWEMDCVCGPTKNVLLVLTERKTRKEIIIPMEAQTCENVVRCLNKIEKKLGYRFKKIFKSITVDNGAEFANCLGLEKSIFGRGSKRTKVYYCHPYCSFERGTNERINREIRRLIPKGSDLSKYTIEDIQKVEDWVNNYPRQVLFFASSRELFEKELQLIA